MTLYLFSVGTLSLKEIIRPLCLKKLGPSDLLFFSWFYIVISITPFTLPTLVTDSYPAITYNFLIDIHFILCARW